MDALASWSVPREVSGEETGAPGGRRPCWRLFERYAGRKMPCASERAPGCEPGVEWFRACDKDRTSKEHLDSCPGTERQRTRPLKILVCGAFATGKSTLCRSVASRVSAAGRDTVYLHEVSRRCPLPLNEAQTPLASAWLMGEQVRCEAYAGSQAVDLILCDRGVPDILSHTVVLRNLGEPEDELRRALVEMGRAWAATYALAFWARLDPCRDIADDGVRIQSKEYQALLEHSIEEAFRLIGMAPVELPSEDGERVDMVCSYLQKCGIPLLRAEGRIKPNKGPG